MHFQLAELDMWPSGYFRDFSTFYNLVITIPFLNWSFTVIAKELLMTVNVDHSILYYVIFLGMFS